MYPGIGIGWHQNSGICICIGWNFGISKSLSKIKAYQFNFSYQILRQLRLINPKVIEIFKIQAESQCAEPTTNSEKRLFTHWKICTLLYRLNIKFYRYLLIELTHLRNKQEINKHSINSYIISNHLLPSMTSILPLTHSILPASTTLNGKELNTETTRTTKDLILTSERHTSMAILNLYHLMPTSRSTSNIDSQPRWTSEWTFFQTIVTQCIGKSSAKLLAGIHYRIQVLALNSVSSWPT